MQVQDRIDRSSTAATTSKPTTNIMSTSGEDRKVLAVFSLGRLHAPLCSMEPFPGRALDPSLQAFAANLSSKAQVASTSSYVLRLNSAMVDHDISTFRGTRTRNGPFVRIRETSKALPEVFLGRCSKALIFVESPAGWTLGSSSRAIEDHPSSQARWSQLFPQVDIDVDSDRPCRQLRGLPNSRGHAFLRSWKYQNAVPVVSFGRLCVPIYHRTNTGEVSSSSEDLHAACHSRLRGHSCLPGATLRTRPSGIIAWLLHGLVFTLVNPARYLPDMISMLSTLVRRVLWATLHSKAT
jgi:hypothetical protein